MLKYAIQDFSSYYVAWNINRVYSGNLKNKTTHLKVNQPPAQVSLVTCMHNHMGISLS